MRRKLFLANCCWLLNTNKIKTKSRQLTPLTTSTASCDLHFCVSVRATTRGILVDDNSVLDPVLRQS